MGRANSKSTLSQNIAEILGTATPQAKTQAPGPLRKSLIYSSMALLAVNPSQAYAVSLGELNVQSQLGQPLNATVPLTLNKGESLPKDCINPSNAGTTLNNPPGMRVIAPEAYKPGTYNLRVTTTNPLREPMYEISLLIDCPGTPVLMRQYVLMLDLVTAPLTSPVISGDVIEMPVSGTPATSAPVARQPQTNPARSLRRQGAPIAAGSQYRVSEGDTLSTIAARIDGRKPDSTWRVANHLFDNNPNAFIRSNPDLIKLGSLINIPDAMTLATLTKSKAAPFKAAPAPVVAKAITPNATTTPAPKPEPARTVTPVVTSSRPEQPATSSEPETSDALTNTAEAVAAGSVIAELNADTINKPAQQDAASSPFADETAPAESLTATITAENTNAESITPKPATIETSQAVATSTTIDNEQGSPLLAVLFGMLLGAILSFVLLRTKLIDGLTQLVRGRKTPVTNLHVPAEPPVKTPIATELKAPVSAPADSVASDSTDEQSEGLQIGNPAEDTYIVESLANDPSIDFGQHVDAKSSVKSEAAPEDNAVLTELFNESFAEPAALESDVFDPTGGVDLTADNGENPTAEMTVDFPLDDDLASDPTAEMPASNTFSEMDETSEMSAAQEEEMDRSLIEALGDTMNEKLDEAALEAGLEDDLSPTAAINPEELGIELDDLPSGDDDLSDELEEALTMLEKEFDDEFTASQILERSEINRTLEDADKNRSDANPLDTNPLKKQGNG